MNAMQKIKGAYPMQVSEIVFDDGSVLEDKTIMFCGDFIIVEGVDGAPTMYNTRTVSKLREVQEIRPETRIGAW